MNRFIKQTMILALALAMSLGAWAQTTVTWTEADLIGSSDQTTFTKDGVTITCSDRISGGRSFNGPVTISTTLGNFTSIAITGAYANAPTTADGFTNDGNVSTWTGNAASISTPASIAYAAQFVFTIAADASPTVTHNTDGSWGFTMPDYNAALNVTYYSLPDLAWTYNSAAMPAAGLTAYRGFELPVIGGIGASMDQDFLNALLGGTVSLRYGSVNGVVTFNNPNDMRSFNVNGPGRDTIYMVFAGNDDFLYDSASFAINILNPDTLTLAANGNGTVSPLMGGSSATQFHTPANWFGQDLEYPTTEDLPGFLATTQAEAEALATGVSDNMAIVIYDRHSDGRWYYISRDNDSYSPHLTNLAKHAFYSFEEGGFAIYYTTAAVSDSIVAAATEGQYLVIHGAEVQVVAEAQDGNYVSAWSDNRQPQHYTSDTNTITVSGSMNLTATFAQNPLLTLSANEGGTVELDGVTGDGSAETLLTTINASGSFTSGSQTFDNVATVTLAGQTTYEWSVWMSQYGDGKSGTITLSAAEGVNVTGYKLYFNYADPYTITASSATLNLYSEGGGRYVYYLGGQIGNEGITKIEVYGTVSTIPAGVEQLTADTYRVLPGTEVTVNATPDEAHYFVNWDEETALNSNTAVEKTLTMGTDDTELTANFQAKPVLTLAQNESWGTVTLEGGSGTGTVQLTDTTYRVDYGTEVKAIATANAGYHMDSWSNQDEVAGLVSDTTETITMTEDMTITATFAQNPTLTIVSNNSEWGSLDIEGVGSGKDKFVTDANQLVYTGRHVKVTATDLYDIGVIRLKNEGQQATIETLNGEIIDSIVVTASMNTHNCSYVLSTSGTVQGGNPTTKIKDVNATSVVLTAQYGVGISNITVYYTSPDKIDVVAIDYESGTYSVLPGTEVSVNATANEGYYVTGWQDENNSDMATATYSEGLYPVTSTLTFTVTGDTTSMAIFEQSFISPEFAWSTETFTAYTMIDFNSWKPTLNNPQDLTVRYGCVEGSVITEGGIPVDETTGIIGSELGIGTVSTKAGTYHIYAVHDFDGNYDYDSVVYTLIVENSATVFVQKNIEEGGAVDFVEPENDLTHNYMNSAALKSVFLAPGADFSVTNTAAEGYHFAKWQTGDNVNGYTDYSTEPNLTYTAPTEFAGSFVEGLKAVFDTNVYNVAYNVQNDTRPQIGTNAPMGSVVLEGQHKHFLNDVLTATAAEGYIFAGWANTSGTVVSTENPFVFSPVSDTTLTATFIVGDYTLSATPNIPTSGQVTGSGSYAYSSDATLEVVPTTGYHFVEWTDAAGNVLGTEPTLTVNVMSDTTVIAVLDTNVYNVAYNVQNDTRPQIGTNAPMGSVVLEGQHKHFLNDVLTATAADGYIFAGWANTSGTVVSTENPFVFSPVSDTTLTATFIVGDYTLSATPNIPTSGQVTGSGSYAYRSTVTLEATPSTGYHFVNWVDGSGNVLGTSTELSVQVLSDSSVTAVFDTNVYNVAYNVQNDTRPQIGTNAPMGSVVLEGQHKHFLNDVLTATAAEGYIFAGWANTSGTVVSTENPFVFSPVSDTTLTATFIVGDYTLSATPNIPTSGQVTGSGSYAYRSTVTLEATPSTGYHFVNWVDGSGNVLGTSTELSVQLLSDSSVTAVFDTNVYNVAYNVQNDIRPQIGTNAPMGSVVLEGQHKHFLNDVLTATAADGYIFAGWANTSGTVVSTENPFAFSPVSDTTLTATFIVGDYTLSATPNIPTSGQVTGSGSYAYRSTVTLEVVPTTGYHLVEWTDAVGNVLGTEPTLTVNVMSDTTVIAVLDTNVYNVAYNVQNDIRPQIGTNAPMGSVVVEGQHKHFLNDVLTATAADGYIFAGWANASGTVVSTANPLVFSPVSDTTLTATFIVGDYTLSATPNIPTSGIVTGIGSYAYRSTVTLEATPSTGYHFVNWVDGSGNVLGTNNELSVQILSDVSVTAVFDTNIYNVAYNVQNDIRPQIGTNAPMGSVVLEGQHKHFLNDVLTATAADGYIFAGWANASGTVVSTENPFVFSPVSDTTLTATFTASNYTLSATPNIPTSGQVTGSGSYAYRSNATLEVVPSAGYHLVEWTDAAGNVLGTEPTLTVNVMSDTTVIAVLDTNVYNVMANVNIVGLGTVTGAGQVKHFLSTDLVATANPGYHFVNWIDNAGNELGTANTITVFPVSDTVLTAVFEANIYTTVWSGNTTTTYNSQPYTGLVATYTDFWGNEHTPMLTFTNGSTTITTPNYPVNAGTWTVTATGEVGDVLTNTVNTLVINPAVVYVSNAVVETAKFVDGNTDAVVTNIGTLNNVQGNDVVTHNTTAVFNDATVGEGKTITLTYSLNGDTELLANYNLDPVTQVYTTNAYIIEPMTPDTNRVSTEDTTVVEEGMDIYAYGYCSGSTYSIRYHLNSGNPDQYKIDFADNRFTDVDWTDLAIAGTDGTIDIEVPVDLPTGDYTLTVTFRDSRFTWLESKPISVSFHVNLPETYTVVLFDNVIALVDTCHCFTDIQWYHRADASSDWYAIPGANGYYYHATDAQLKGEFFVKVRMNGIETYTCPQTDMETLYSDNEQSVSVKAYPNPTTERVTIAISGSMEPVHKLRIINNLGVEMESSTFEGDSTVINMSNYQQGNYMVTVDGAVVIVIRN